MELKDKVALITGGAKRVGRSIAQAFASEGAKVIIHYKTSERDAKATADEILKNGGKASYVQADLSLAVENEKFVNSALKIFGTIDILVNSASIYYPVPLNMCNEEEFDKFISINLKSPYILSTLIGIKMKERGSGKIINIIDSAVTTPYANYLPYMISKGGLVTLTKALAVELAPEVQVNGVSPGPVLKPENMERQVYENASENTLLKRTGNPKDVAYAVCFLAKSADFVTGQIIVVDGGRELA
jgi:pteridine reductase